MQSLCDICFQNEGNHYTFTNEFDWNLVQAQPFEFENRNKTSLCSHTHKFDRNLVQAQHDCEFDRFKLLYASFMAISEDIWTMKVTIPL